PGGVIPVAEGQAGLESTRACVLLSSPAIAPLHLLHHVTGPPASFLASDPRLVLPGYRAVLSIGDRRRLGAGDETALVWLALVTIDPDQGPTMNLRAPIVINPERMIGFQTMPHNSLYPLRHPLALR